MPWCIRAHTHTGSPDNHTHDRFTHTEGQVCVFMSLSRIERERNDIFVRTHSVNCPDSGSIFLTEAKELKNGEDENLFEGDHSKIAFCKTVFYSHIFIMV